jgi:hypothetical protein
MLLFVNNRLIKKKTIKEKMEKKYLKKKKKDVLILKNTFRLNE